MENCLWTKVYETYKTFPTHQHGGLLLFIIMMKLLISCSEHATKHLIEVVENLKISKVEWGNFLLIVSLVWGAHERLSHNNSVPEEFTKKVLTILQTSSVPEFNALFEHIKTSMDITSGMACIKDTPSHEPATDDLLVLAEDSYLDMCQDSKWSGTSTWGKSRFLGDDSPKLTCWNCGRNHHIKDCPEPHNEDLIKANKKFNSNKETKLGSSKSLPKTDVIITSLMTNPGIGMGDVRSLTTMLVMLLWPLSMTPLLSMLL